MRTTEIVTLAAIMLCGCYSHTKPGPQLQDDVRFQCNGPRPGKPPESIYLCTIDIPEPADHERWLIIPSMMESVLDPRQAVVMMEMEETPEGFSYCGSLRHMNNFDALPVPAGTRLHLDNWRLETMANRHTLTAWLGATPTLSTGNTLGDICRKLINATPDASGPFSSGHWQAPKGTTMQLAGGDFVKLWPVRPQDEGPALGKA